MCDNCEDQVKHYKKHCKAALDGAICLGAETEAKLQSALSQVAEMRQEAADKSQEEAEKFDHAMTIRDLYKEKHQEALEKNRALMRKFYALKQRTEKAELRVAVTEAKFQTILGRCNTMAAQQVADAAALSALPSTPPATRKRIRAADCECVQGSCKSVQGSYKGPVPESALLANEPMRYMNNPSRTW